MFFKIQHRETQKRQHKGLFHSPRFIRAQKYVCFTRDNLAVWGDQLYWLVDTAKLNIEEPTAQLIVLRVYDKNFSYSRENRHVSIQHNGSLLSIKSARWNVRKKRIMILHYRYIDVLCYGMP